MVAITICQATSVPDADTFGKTDAYVVITGPDNLKVRTATCNNDDNPEWNETLKLEVSPQDLLTVSLYDKDTVGGDDLIGRIEISAADLTKRPSCSFMLEKSKDDHDMVCDGKHAPTRLFIKVDLDSLPANWPVPVEPDYSKYSKHVMMISRGTRGDVQPFVALARGLAETLGWMVTICAELRWKDFIKKNSKVSKGCIRFRPAGGDTTSRINNSALAKWAMSSTSEVMQATMLARSEGEFFASEAALFSWADQLKPDVLVFGFTLANIAMIISEALKIPLIGFVLQPTCIPSDQYPTVIPINTHSLGLVDKMEQNFTTHSLQSKLKVWMENNPFTRPLDQLRQSRGLKPFAGMKSQTWQRLVKQNTALLVPIHPHAFGGKPHDWAPASVLSDFIFLRGGGVPALADDLSAFIAAAKEAKRPTLVMAFSSMPVPRKTILEYAIKIASLCDAKPRVIALVGNRDMSKEAKDEDVEAQADALKSEQRIFEAGGAPFGLLFSKMDCIIMHGGLGTTAEALRVGVPVMVTGLLLMDQRFWGAQVHKLQQGKEPVHISRFGDVCVDNVNAALGDEDWKARAVTCAASLKGETDDGVGTNVSAFAALARAAVPFQTVEMED